RRASARPPSSESGSAGAEAPRRPVAPQEPPELPARLLKPAESLFSRFHPLSSRKNEGRRKKEEGRRRKQDKAYPSSFILPSSSFLTAASPAEGDSACLDAESVPRR